MRTTIQPKKRSRFRNLLFIILAVILLISVADYIRNSNYITLPMKPDPAIVCEQDRVYFDLLQDSAEIDWDRLDGTLRYIRNEYDCADFRLVNLVRILYDFGDLIPREYMNRIETVLFNFRYWWDQPGENSMCYWSENHQILFASAEYLIGQRYPDVIFPNSGMSGKQHMEKAGKRAMEWLEMRWNYGFIEYYSNVYYKEDIAALTNLIDYASDEELVRKSQIILDLLFYDIASQSLGTYFISTSGRAYQRNRTGLEDVDFGGLTSYFWGDGKDIGPGMMYGMMRTTKYSLPPVLRDIALDTSRVEIRQSNGLDLTELKAEGYYGTDNRSLMMQWGMEAFTNPSVVRNSLAHIRETRMFTNAFLGDFKILNYKLLRWLHLEPVLVRIINPQTNGVAIQKGNTYTYRTRDYSLYTVQQHQVGDYADQQHVSGMNIGDHFSIFHNHPALEKEVERQSPNYWVGYGHFPHSAQDKNVNLSIYNIPEKKGVMEAALLDYTRAFFPVTEFDSAYMEGRYLFGKKGSTYCAMIGASDFIYRDSAMDDVIQHGKKCFWITEAGSASEDGSFSEFTRRIMDNRVSFDPETLHLFYETKGTRYELLYNVAFAVNGEVIDTNYKRYDSPYAQAGKKDKTITISFKNRNLFLDFENLKREF